jgi:hypothetical protein
MFIGVAVIAVNAPTLSILLGLGLAAFAVSAIKRHRRPALAFVFAHRRREAEEDRCAWLGRGPDRGFLVVRWREYAPA